MEVVCSGRYKDLKDKEVLLEAKWLLFIGGQLHFACAAQGENTTLHLLTVGLADGTTFFLPLFKRVLALKAQNFDGWPAME